MKRATHSWNALLVGFTLILLTATQALAQQAKLTVDDDCIAFTFSPDGSRIVYAALRRGNQKGPDGKKVPVEHDDIGEITLDGHKHRLVDGSKLVKSDLPFSYQIQSIRIAPDDQHMTVQMITRALVPQGERGRGPAKVQSGVLTDLMDGRGKEINIEGTKNSVINNGVNAAWLADGQTVVYMKQTKDSLLYTLAYVRPTSGVGGAMLPNHYYAAVTWNPKHNVAAAIERDEDLQGPIRLVWIDLVHQSQSTIATLDGFAGHLTVSPSATKIAYYRDGNTIEIRSVADPGKVTQIKVPNGRYEWSVDETHLLLKRGPTTESDRLIWISLPGGEYHDVFRGLIYRNFHISPDGRWVGVTEPGMQVLKLYPIP